MSHKISKSEIAADRAALRAIEGLTDYQAVNSLCSVEALQELDATLRAAEEASEQARQVYERARQAYEQTRDVEENTARTAHERMRTAKAQVMAQYGPDSYAVKAIGWTRTSDRKRPTRKASAE
jgi:ABC-type transporter lipoprotein component MlaA